MSILRIYARLAVASLRAKMQYKLDFLVNTLLWGALTTADFLMLAAIMLRFERVGGWDIYEVGLLYGMAWIATGLYRTFASELHNFDQYVVHGEFDALLVRPWPTLLTLLGRNLEPHRLGAVLQGAIILGLSARHLLAVGTLDRFGLVYVLASSIYGALIPFSLSLITAAFAFWVVRTGDLLTFTIYAPISASQYPLTIYPRWLKTLLLSVLPVGFINFIPVQYLLGKGGGPWALVFSPAVAVGFTLAAYGLWRAGERRYQSTGS